MKDETKTSVFNSSFRLPPSAFLTSLCYDDEALAIEMFRHSMR